MMREDLEVPPVGLLPPTNPRTEYLGNLWNNVLTNITYESLRLCSEVQKIIVPWFERRKESTCPDYILQIMLILAYSAFITFSYCLLKKGEKKPIKEVLDNAKKTANASFSILKAFWTFRDIKHWNLRREVLYKKTNKTKNPSDMSVRSRCKEIEDVAIVVPPIKISNSEIFYSHEEELPIEIDCISESRSTFEIASSLLSMQLSFNNLPKEISVPVLQLPNTEVGDVVKSKKIMRKKLDTVSSVKSKRDFRSTTLEAIPEVNCDVEATSPRKKWKSKILPTPKDCKSKKQKLEQHNLPNINVKPAKNTGIFSERKKVQEKLKAMKTTEQTKNGGSVRSTPRSNKTSTCISKTPKELPKKSGIFKKSKREDRPRSDEKLNKHK